MPHLGPGIRQGLILARLIHVDPCQHVRLGLWTGFRLRLEVVPLLFSEYRPVSIIVTRFQEPGGATM